jgi:rhodanese-related sulfurtransferase
MLDIVDRQAMLLDMLDIAARFIVPDDLLLHVASLRPHTFPYMAKYCDNAIDSDRAWEPQAFAGRAGGKSSVGSYARFWLPSADWLQSLEWGPIPGKKRIARMAKHHSPHFLKLVQDAKTRIREVNVDQVKAKLDRGEKFILVDVREESEWAKDHLPNAIHLGKGVIERDIEQRVPDPGTELILYCGGGYRSALAADNLQKMGYTNVLSMDGGYSGWRGKAYPLVSE